MPAVCKYLPLLPKNMQLDWRYKTYILPIPQVFKTLNASHTKVC